MIMISSESLKLGYSSPEAIYRLFALVFEVSKSWIFKRLIKYSY